MISEAMGKILGMAMAYGVSSLGLFLAYVNYRRRIVKAEKVMTPTAWAVVAAVVLATAAGVAVVWRLAEPPVVETAKAAEPPVAETATVAETTAVAPPGVPAAAPAGERDRWPLVGIVIPAAIFLLATWVTAALHRRFTRHGHGPATGPKSSPP